MLFLGIGLGLNVLTGSVKPAVGAAGDDILLETGDHELLESGATEVILLE